MNDRIGTIDSEKDFAKLTDKEKYTFKKRENERISRLYYVASEQEKDARLKKRFENQSENIRNCSNTVLEYTDTSKQDAKPQYLTFRCKSRFCPLCLYVDSRETFKLVLDIVNHPLAKDFSYIFITLTVRNCKESELSKTVDLLLDSFYKLIKDKTHQFAKRFEGIFRVLESTYNKKTKTYHPHLHLLVMVKKEYFTDVKKYLTKTKLIEIWQKALNVGYKPSVDIRATYNAEAKTVAEVSKYTVKSSEIVNVDVLRTYDVSFYKRRLRSMSGVFRTLKAEVEKEWRKNKDTLSFKEILCNDSFVKNLYRWDFFNREFKITKTNNQLQAEGESTSSKLIRQLQDEL